MLNKKRYLNVFRNINYFYDLFVNLKINKQILLIQILGHLILRVLVNNQVQLVYHPKKLLFIPKFILILLLLALDLQ